MATPLRGSQIRSLNKLGLEFIKECIFEFMRYVERMDYDVVHTHRLMPYARQMGMSFHSRIGRMELESLLVEVFYKSKAEIQSLQSKIANNMLLAADKPIHAYYYVMQEYLFEGEYISVRKMAEQVREISHDAFLEYYHYLVGQLSMVRDG